MEQYLFTHLDDSKFSDCGTERSSDIDDSDKYGFMECSMCHINLNNECYQIFQHPYLRVPLCILCHDLLNQRIELENEEEGDGICTWCGLGGCLFECSSEDCQHYFCTDCVQENLGEEALANIQEDDDWKCLVCCEDPQEIYPRMQSYIDALEAATYTSMYNAASTAACAEETDGWECDQEVQSILQKNYDFLSAILLALQEGEAQLESEGYAKRRNSIHSEVIRRPDNSLLSPEQVEAIVEGDFEISNQTWKRHVEILQRQELDLQDIIENLDYDPFMNPLYSELHGDKDALEKIEPPSIAFPSAAPIDEHDYYKESEERAEKANPKIDELRHLTAVDPDVLHYRGEKPLSEKHCPPSFHQVLPSDLIHALVYSAQDSHGQSRFKALCKRYSVPPHVAVVLKWMRRDAISQNCRMWSFAKSLHGSILKALFHCDDAIDREVLQVRYKLPEEVVSMDDCGDIDAIASATKACKQSAFFSKLSANEYHGEISDEDDLVEQFKADMSRNDRTERQTFSRKQKELLGENIEERDDEEQERDLTLARLAKSVPRDAHIVLNRRQRVQQQQRDSSNQRRRYGKSHVDDVQETVLNSAFTTLKTCSNPFCLCELPPSLVFQWVGARYEAECQCGRVNSRPKMDLSRRRAMQKTTTEADRDVSDGSREVRDQNVSDDDRQDALAYDVGDDWRNSLIDNELVSERLQTAARGFHGESPLHTVHQRDGQEISRRSSGRGEHDGTGTAAASSLSWTSAVRKRIQEDRNVDSGSDRDGDSDSSDPFSSIKKPPAKKPRSSSVADSAAEKSAAARFEKNNIKSESSSNSTIEISHKARSKSTSTDSTHHPIIIDLTLDQEGGSAEDEDYDTIIQGEDEARAKRDADRLAKTRKLSPSMPSASASAVLFISPKAEDSIPKLTSQQAIFPRLGAAGGTKSPPLTVQQCRDLFPDPHNALLRDPSSTKMRDQVILCLNINDFEPEPIDPCAAEAPYAPSSIAWGSDGTPIFMIVPFVQLLKPHQRQGVAFLFKCVFGKGDRFKRGDAVDAHIHKRDRDTPVGGCILAHSMGLGKTFTVISFTATLLCSPDLYQCDASNAADFNRLHEASLPPSLPVVPALKRIINTVLIIAPVSTLQNWRLEYDKWVKEIGKCSDLRWAPSKLKSILNVRVLEAQGAEEQPKKKADLINRRINMLASWQREGGVLVIGYELFGGLVALESEKPQSDAVRLARSYLLDPGPDIVICDEVHTIKTSTGRSNTAISQIRTHRRVGLTGSPLQNNLTEYFVMIDWARPGFLGKKASFDKQFKDPIQAGQHNDASSEQRKKMKGRAFLLNKKVREIVDRRDMHELEKSLPKKRLFVITVRMSDSQSFLYKKYIEICKQKMKTKSSNLIFAAFQGLLKVCNHPGALALETLVQEKSKGTRKADIGLNEVWGELNDVLRVVREKGVSAQALIRETAAMMDDDQDKVGRKRKSIENENYFDDDLDDLDDDDVDEMEEIDDGPGYPLDEIAEKCDIREWICTACTYTNDCDASNEVCSMCWSMKVAPLEARDEEIPLLISANIGEAAATGAARAGGRKGQDEDTSCKAAEVPLLTEAPSREPLLTEAPSRGPLLTAQPQPQPPVVMKDKIEPIWWREMSASGSSSVTTHMTTEDLLKMTEMGPKVCLFLQMLALTCNQGEKILLFTQSIFTLNFLELLLQQDWGTLAGYEPSTELRSKGRQFKQWTRDVRGYCRLDGATKDRQRLIDEFNNDESQMFNLFLISIRAGNMGINLQAANRIILFDTSWNPVNDLQALHRSYRYGQTRPVFVYRLLVGGSMEEKIYRQQIVKQVLAARVVDGEAPKSAFTEEQVKGLFHFGEGEDRSGEVRSATFLELQRVLGQEPRDTVLQSVLQRDHAEASQPQSQSQSESQVKGGM